MPTKWSIKFNSPAQTQPSDTDDDTSDNMFDRSLTSVKWHVTPMKQAPALTPVKRRPATPVVVKRPATLVTQQPVLTLTCDIQLGPAALACIAACVEELFL
jgi:hypothetical protein